jgi:hypothetical protein
MIGTRSVLGVAVLVWWFPAATLAQQIGVRPMPMPVPSSPTPLPPPLPGLIPGPSTQTTTLGPTIQLSPPAPNISVPQAAAGAGGPAQPSSGGKTKLRKCSCYVPDPANHSRSKVGCEPQCCADTNAEPCN